MFAFVMLRAWVDRVVIAAAMVGTAAVMGCVGEPIVNVPASGIVMTFNDGSVDFGGLTTFAMPDTVVHYGPTDGVSDLPRQFDSVALRRVRQDFLARGYTEVADPVRNKPSFIVLVGAIATTDYRPWTPYNWYSMWGFYPGWGWYSPGFNSDWMIFFPWSVVFSGMVVDRGTIVVTLIPTTSVNQINKSVKSAWAGLATSELDDVPLSADGVRFAIDEMFRQSPFLVADASLDRHGGARAGRASAPY